MGTDGQYSSGIWRKRIAQQRLGQGHLYYIDAAFGYYKVYDERLVLELYGGLGTSWQRHNYVSEDDQGLSVSGDARINFYKFFIQPNIGFKSKYVEAAFALPLSRVDFYGLSGDLSAYQTERRVLQRLSQAGGIFLLEPSFSLRFGGKNVKIQIQYIYSSPLAEAQERFVRGSFSIGLQVALVLRKRQE